jgi:hypothetical protein
MCVAGFIAFSLKEYMCIYIYEYIYIYICFLELRFVGLNSSVGVATLLGAGRYGIEYRSGQDFLHPSRPVLGPT